MRVGGRDSEVQSRILRERGYVCDGARQWVVGETGKVMEFEFWGTERRSVRQSWWRVSVCVAEVMEECQLPAVRAGGLPR